MVTFGSTSETSTELRKYTRDLYKRLEAETGQATGLKQFGFIEVATDEDTLEEYRRVSAFNRYCGVDVQEISPAQVQGTLSARQGRRHRSRLLRERGRTREPGRRHDGARQGRAHARAQRSSKACACTGVLQQRGKVTGVQHAHGDIAGEYVVNCAGMWARQLGAMSGVNIPIQAAEHYYLITEEIHDLPKNMPGARGSLASHCYFREEVGGLMVGLFEPVCAPGKSREFRRTSPSGKFRRTGTG